MRRRLAWLSLAVSSLVVVAFLIPLGILVHNQAENRELTRAERDAQSIAAVLAVAGSTEAGSDVSPRLARSVVEAFGSRPGISIVFPDGTIEGEAVDVSENMARAQAGAAFTARVSGGAEVLVPVLVADAPAAEGTVVVRSFAPDEDLTRGVTLAWVMLFGLGVFLILVAMAAADALGRTIVRPVTALSEAATRLGEGDLGTRVEPEGPAEVAEVGEAFNFLAGRLGGLLEAERESVADLSHRLRTPLTALRLQAETLSDLREAQSLLADITRMENAVDKMIEEARRPTSGTTPPKIADLGEVVRHRASFWQVLADDQGRPTTVFVDPGAHPVEMSEQELGALVDVLIENVFAHTDPGSGYNLRVGDRSDEKIQLTVEDSGAGFRDLSVTRRGKSSTGSTGLGLDIVAKAAQRTGGVMRIGRASTGGAEIVVVFGRAEAGDVPGGEEPRPSQDAIDPSRTPQLEAP
jgi:signal transduction histidine kinase